MKLCCECPEIGRLGCDPLWYDPVGDTMTYPQMLITEAIKGIAIFTSLYIVWASLNIIFGGS